MWEDIHSGLYYLSNYTQCLTTFRARSDLHYTFINGYIQARNRILANILGVERPSGTQAVSHGTGERTQENDLTNVKIQSARKRLHVAQRSLNTCELTIQHGNPILTCGYPSLMLYSQIMIGWHRKYNFKAKKQKVSDTTGDLELEESVRTISALFSQNGGVATRPLEASAPGEPLEARVASISAEIAAAIAQASSRALDEDEDEMEEEEGVDDDDGWCSGHEIRRPETIVPNTSGIRGSGSDDSGKGFVGVEDNDEDSDTFPIPLRTRKGKEPVSLVGIKRKR